MGALEDRIGQAAAEWGPEQAHALRYGGRRDAAPPLRWAQLPHAVVVERGDVAYAVYGAIHELYAQLGGPLSGLGAPTSEEQDTGDGVGRVSTFVHGQIYWSPTTGAHEVHGEIMRFYLADAAHPGTAPLSRISELGYPLTDELATPTHCYQFFERGSLVFDRSTGVTRPGCPPDRLFGWADTHGHPATHLAFGGNLLHGEPAGEARRALRPCEETHGDGGLHVTSFFAGLLGSASVIGGVAAVSAVARTGLQSVLEGSLGHKTHGYAEDGHFDGWPRWNAVLHQSMHISWLRRCHTMGQRLMVALVTSSELLGALAGGPAFGRYTPGTGADAVQVRQQLEYIKSQLVTEGADFMSIVYSATEARAVIAEGRLALVLGVELDDLLRLAPRPEVPSQQQVTDVIGMLHDMGVRYGFPLHLTDNAFGDMALYQWYFEQNSTVTGRGAPRHRPDPEVDYGAEGGGPGVVNDGPGLTELGRHLLDAMAAKKWMIDIDHMSWRTTEGALEWARRRSYPLVSGHATLNDVVVQGDAHHGRNESRKRRHVLESIAALGGFVGLQTLALALRPGAGRPLTSAPADGTTHGFAWSYLLARESLGDRVVLGSDANGLAGLLGPRFGPDAAPLARGVAARAEQERGQRGGVRYIGPVSYLDADRYETDFWEGLAGGTQVMSPEQVEHLRVALAAEPGQGPERWLHVIPGLDERLSAVATGVKLARAGRPRPAGDQAQLGWVAASYAEGVDSLPQHQRQTASQLRETLQRRDTTPGVTSPVARCRTGRRDWDYNYDGLAHYGLLPDLILDVANLGLRQDTELLPLLRGSEVVVSTWERCEDATRPVPARTLTLDPPTIGRATLDFYEIRTPRSARGIPRPRLHP